MRRLLLAALATATVCSACGRDAAPEPVVNAPITVPVTGPATVPVDGVQRFPDVLDAVATETSPGVWRFDVTMSSPYDTPGRYADAWRVAGDDDEEGGTVVYGVRELAHDHQDEQPFTRSLSGVAIPDDVGTVVVEGRDQRYGWGGATVEVTLR